MTITNTEAVSDLREPISGRVWPLSGYAPGNYHCQCVDCGKIFEGDKRAVQCLDCAVRSVNNELLSRRAANSAGGVKEEAPRREEQIAAMSVELQKHPTFDDNPVGALVWSTRLFDAIVPAVEAEPVAWQWSDFSGNWYTVDTNLSRMPASQQEAIAIACAASHGGRLRKLYTHPAPSASREVTVTDDDPRVTAVARLYGNFVDGHGWTGFGPSPAQIAAALTLPERGM